MKDIFHISYDTLPVSVNDYLKPSSRMQGNRRVHFMYESQEAKDFKKMFSSYLKREIRKQGWNIEDTNEGHWHLDCVFVQARTNQDNNNYYKILLDSMTGHVIADDKNVLPRTMRVFYDSKNPRFYAKLYRSDSYGIWETKDKFDKFYESNCALCTKNKDKCSFLKKALESRLDEESIPAKQGFNSCSKIRVKK